MKSTILDKLACPICAAFDKSDSRLSLSSDTKAGETPALFCNKCKSCFNPIDGILNLAGEVVAQKYGSAQWAMEFGPLVAAYDKIWRPYFTGLLCDFEWEMEMSRQLMDVSSGMDVLDLGCGTGNFTRLFSDLAKPGAVIGMDLSLPMLKKGMNRLAEQKNSDFMLMRADVMKWPFAPETFDRIHCAGSLHLFPDPQNVFDSVYRSLKKGGYFVVATYCQGGNFALRGLMKLVSKTQGVHWFEPQELQNLSSTAGFAGWEQRTLRRGVVFKVQK
jgi:ubiquinone/menaquinone biosynthesis C-methylase UbiE/uncharacterized protein YbaR (Trm112 family)